MPTPKRQPLPSPPSSPPSSNLDAFLARLNKCLSTPSGIDTVMLFICYTSKLSSAILSSLSKSALRRSAREWIALVASLPRGTTVVFSSPTATVGGKTAIPSAAALALLFSKRLAALSGLMSEARLILRLWALLGMYFWARDLLRKTFSSSKDASEKQSTPKSTKLDTTIEFLRLGLCIILQSLENGAYLSARGVMSWTPAQQGKAYLWSARFWAAYVGIELGKLAAERFGPATTIKTQEEKSEWKKKAAKNLAWAPLTLHWSSEKGLVSELAVGALASIPGFIQIRDLWASTA
ncbi:hypothetical protein N0V88_001878 [Collariella sp. IMI 366227]|nr:hypothetical protein N0V88_001878 [Collariella sp. IMI 366227]